MTAEAMVIVMHHSTAKGTDKLVALGIANHDGDGGSWPSVQTLAYYANVDPRSVQRSIDKLIAAGEVTQETNAGGSAKTADHMRPNLYEVVLKCPPNCDGTKAHNLICRRCGKVLRGPHKAKRLIEHPGCRHMLDGLEHNEQKGVTPTSGGDTHVTPPLTPTSPELHLEPPMVTNSTTHVPNRVCASGPRRGYRHTFEGDARYCTWCAAPREDA